MNWEEKALVKIRNNFAHRNFTPSEAAKVLTSYSQGTIYRLLNDLAREGKMTKVGYGIFRAEPRGEGIEAKGRSLTPNLERATKLLSDAGINFMLTGYSVLGSFIHLFPRRAVHLVYVELGAGESAVEALENGGFTALLNPKSEREVNLTLGLTKRDLFVIRERRELSGNTKGGVASMERGLIDLYFESTRRRIPFPEVEVGRIMRDAMKLGGLDVSRLTKLASRRGIAGEIRAILKAEAEFPAGRGKTVFNEHVKAVLADTVR
jgi:hypothetical protein